MSFERQPGEENQSFRDEDGTRARLRARRRRRTKGQKWREGKIEKGKEDDCKKGCSEGESQRIRKRGKRRGIQTQEAVNGLDRNLLLL